MTFMLMIVPLIVVEAALAAPQMSPCSLDNEKVLIVDWAEGKEVVLDATPRQAVTVFLVSEEQIRRVTLGQDGMIAVQVSGNGKSFTILPLDNLSSVSMLVETGSRLYPFYIIRSDRESAPHIVRFNSESTGRLPDPSPLTVTQTEQSKYKVRGDKSVRPAAISDDGRKTFIDFFPDQALPAVFAIGSTGEEEMVNGNFREGRYVIDRVYGELVFRIDKDRATARRQGDDRAR